MVLGNYIVNQQMHNFIFDWSVWFHLTCLVSTK